MLGVSKLKWVGLSGVVVLLDQWTKWLALEHLEYARSVPVVPGLDWTLLYNRGMAFSLFSDGGWQIWMLTILTAIVGVAIAIWLFRTPRDHHWQGCALALILGGAIGNLIDRLRFGHVVDFIDVHYGQWHWPAFNIADSGITVGAVILAFILFFEGREEPPRADG